MPSAGKGEFPRLQESLAEVQRELDAASDGLAAVLASAASESDDEARLAAHARAAAMLDSMKPRASVFEKRAREPDPDKRVYGPKMAQKVLDLCAALEVAGDKSSMTFSTELSSSAPKFGVTVALSP